MVIAELTEIIELLEARIPANPNSPKNLKQRERLKGKMAKYFTDMEKAFPYSKLAQIFNKYVEKE